MMSINFSRTASGTLTLLVAFVACLGLTAVACGDGGIGGTGDPNFSAEPETITFGSVDMGQSGTESVEITNTGSDPLNLRDIELQNDVGDSLSPAGDWPNEIELLTEESTTLSVQYAPQSEEDHAGRITMGSNDGDQEIDIQTLGLGPELFVDPEPIDFPQTPAGSTDWQVAEIQNIGTGIMEVDSIEITSGEADYSVSFFEDRDSGIPPREDDSQSMPTNEVAADGDPIYTRVLFEPDDEEPSHGEMTVTYHGGQQHVVDLSGNSGDACLEVTPSGTVDFGPAGIDQTTYETMSFRNCSPEAELNIYDITITDDDGGVFSIGDNDLPAGLPDDEHRLDPGEMTTTLVGFAPTDETSYSGEMVIESDDSQNPSLEVPLEGEGVDAECPIAVAEGSVAGAMAIDHIEATNQDVVDLYGSDSSDPDGTDLTYEWSVLQRPNGSLADIEPDHTQADPEFEVDIVGFFELELTVYDEHGLSNCEPAIVTIDATPDEDIHVQLVWEAPEVNQSGGPDGNAQRGTDLDIHYVHEDSYWGENDVINWTNTEENWGGDGTAVLDIDDLWGEDPENINHSDPMNERSYRVGVHYYCDKNWGPADATVRIYFGVNIHDEFERRMEATDHFWYVGDINWGEPADFTFHDQYQTSMQQLSSCDGLL